VHVLTRNPIMGEDYDVPRDAVNVPDCGMVKVMAAGA